jgi:hypothetical protein
MDELRKQGISAVINLKFAFLNQAVRLYFHFGMINSKLIKYKMVETRKPCNDGICGTTQNWSSLSVRAVIWVSEI